MPPELQNVVLTVAPLPPVATGDRLKGLPRRTILFPPCAQELLSLIRTTGVEESQKDDVTRLFDDYFKFGQPHQPLSGPPGDELDPRLRDCLAPPGGGGGLLRAEGGWPGDCCVCSPSCLTLDGGRNGVGGASPGVRRLFQGDAVGLFFWDRLGVFQILGVILDAFATNGRLPISNGAAEPGLRDDLVAVVLELMVRETMTGLASSTRARNALYRTTAGWVTDAGRKLDLDTEVNVGFNQLFHRFVFHALEFYRDKRMAVAIQGAAGGGARPSVATLITIGDTLDVLRRRFEPFDYGRNAHNALSGLVWLLAGMSVIRELRTTLGIPPAYGDPHEYIPAAYDLLVLRRPITHGETNRYLLHRECALDARDILLDLEVLNFTDRAPGGELDRWLNQIEAKVEGYRTAYRALTGLDLGASPTPAVEQQV